jgi:hypothetical protein
VSYGLILPWLQVFVIPVLKEGCETFIGIMNKFKGFVPV